MRTSPGFTLVELSIVLVIIGLVIGGVLVGQEMVYASQVRATVKQYQELDSAVNAFKLKYGCLPGDCANAYTTYGFTGFYGSTTPYGNGNGLITWTEGPTSGEFWDFWAELNQAGLIPSKVPDFYLPKVFPAGGYLSNNGWSVYNVSESILSGYNFGVWVARTLTGHSFLLISNTYNSWGYIIMPKAAYDIDSKVDDGLPSSGKIRPGPSQTTGTNMPGADYNTSGTTRCMVFTSRYQYNVTNQNFACSLFMQSSF